MAEFDARQAMKMRKTYGALATESLLKGNLADAMRWAKKYETENNALKVWRDEQLKKREQPINLDDI